MELCVFISDNVWLRIMSSHVDEVSSHRWHAILHWHGTLPPRTKCTFSHQFTNSLTYSSAYCIQLLLQCFSFCLPDQLFLELLQVDEILGIVSALCLLLIAEQTATHHCIIKISIKSSQRPKPASGAHNAAIPQRVTWRHRTRDYSIGHMSFPVDGPLEPSFYLLTSVCVRGCAYSCSKNHATSRSNQVELY